MTYQPGKQLWRCCQQHPSPQKAWNDCDNTANTSGLYFTTIANWRGHRRLSAGNPSWGTGQGLGGLGWASCHGLWGPCSDPGLSSQVLCKVLIEAGPLNSPSQPTAASRAPTAPLQNLCVLTGLALGSPPRVSERARGTEGKPGCERGGSGRSSSWLWLLFHPRTGSHRGWCTGQGSTRGTGRI